MITQFRGGFHKIPLMSLGLQESTRKLNKQATCFSGAEREREKSSSKTKRHLRQVKGERNFAIFDEVALLWVTLKVFALPLSSRRTKSSALTKRFSKLRTYLSRNTSKAERKRTSGDVAAGAFFFLLMVFLAFFVMVEGSPWSEDGDGDGVIGNSRGVFSVIDEPSDLRPITKQSGSFSTRGSTRSAKKHSSSSMPSAQGWNMPMMNGVGASKKPVRQLGKATMKECGQLNPGANRDSSSSKTMDRSLQRQSEFSALRDLRFSYFGLFHFSYWWNSAPEGLMNK